MPFRPSFADLPAFLKIPAGTSALLEQPLRLARRAWRWWTDELLAMVPARLRERVLDLMPKTFLVERDEDEIVTRELRSGIRASSRPSVERRSISWEQAAASLPEHTRVVIVLPENTALIAEAALPPASLTALRAAASLQLERHVPFRPDDAYYDVHRPAPGSGSEPVASKIAVIPRRKLDPIFRSIGERKLSIRQVQLRLADGTLDDRFNFGWSVRWFGQQPLVREQMAALVLAGVLSVIAVAMVERRWENERLALETAIELSAAGAKHTRGLDDQIEAALSRITAVRQMENALDTLNLMEDLAERLPDGTWLETVSFKPEQIVLAGYCPDAADVSKAIEASPYLLNVALKDLTLARDASGVERFELQANLGGKR